MEGGPYFEMAPKEGIWAPVSEAPRSGPHLSQARSSGLGRAVPWDFVGPWNTRGFFGFCLFHFQLWTQWTQDFKRLAVVFMVATPVVFAVLHASTPHVSCCGSRCCRPKGPYIWHGLCMLSFLCISLSLSLSCSLPL